MGDEKSHDLLVPIQLRAEFKLPAGEVVELPGPQFGNDLVPVGNSTRRDAQGLGSDGRLRFSWVEECQYVFLEHAVDYTMLNGNTTYAQGNPTYHVPMETMGERIRTLRQARGLSQSQLAERLGITTGAVSHWESGNTQNIKILTFLQLCSELGTTPHYLALGPNHKGHPPATSSGKRQGS
jgi:DNA-binding Xre family transcriptional regulator